MSEQSVGINFDANIEGLLGTLKVAKTAIDDAFNLKRLSAEERQKPVADLFRTMEHSSDAAIRGMIRGTQTWQSALMNVASNLEIRFAQLAARRVLNWVQGELGMTAATQTGNAVRTASDEQAGATSLAAKAQRAISAILNDAKEVFGGIFAFLSPMMGPAAAGPAAAGSASVAGLASSVLYAETGAWHIPGNTLAYLHAGEMVVPQPFADSLRSSGGIGGGDAYSITIQAVDTKTGAEFLKNNAAAIASAISGQVRNFNRQVPAWKS
jgi:hypothetical protein